jgi:hypothetical protein
VAGLAFGLILGTAIHLLNSAIPESLPEYGDWVMDLSRRAEVETALALIPFAGIAFLWFIAVIRAELGGQGDRFLETVFLGSGLLFVATLFSAAAVLMSVLAVGDAGVAVTEATAAQTWLLSSTLMGSFGARMAAVFAMAVSSSGIRGARMPRPLVALGYATGLLLLFTPPLPQWAQLLFPLWVIALSLHVLMRKPDEPREHQPTPPRLGGGHHDQ